MRGQPSLRLMDHVAAWATLIQTCAPGSKVLLVGSHADEVEGGEAEVERRNPGHDSPGFAAGRPSCSGLTLAASAALLRFAGCLAPPRPGEPEPALRPQTVRQTQWARAAGGDVAQQQQRPGRSAAAAMPAAADTPPLPAAGPALAALRAATQPHPDQPSPWATLPTSEFRGGSAPAAPSFLSTDQVAQFSEAGFCVVHGAFDEATLAPVRAELDRFEAKTEARLAKAQAEAAAEKDGGGGGRGKDINVANEVRPLLSPTPRPSRR
eukprot:COSAG04_NODE_2701_length_3710_cov_27.658820_1_plen_266_part_00